MSYPYRWWGKNCRYNLASELGIWWRIQDYYKQKDGGFHYRRPFFLGQGFRSARTAFTALSLPALFLLFPFHRLSLASEKTILAVYGAAIDQGDPSRMINGKIAPGLSLWASPPRRRWLLTCPDKPSGGREAGYTNKLCLPSPGVKISRFV